MANVTRQLIAKIRSMLPRRQPPPHAAVLKWDRNQPRGEKGTHLGGKWVKGVSAGVVDASEAPKEDSWLSANAARHEAMGNASYAAIMNAPTGTGFGNTPRAVNFQPPTKPPVASVASVLATGTVKDSEPLGGTANTTVKVEFEDGTEAIFKPEIGENWGSGGGFFNGDISRRITNKDFSLAEREATAYEIGQALFGDKNPVPETVLRTSLPGVDLDNLGSGDDEDGGGGGWDPAELVQMYESYREKAIDNVNVGSQMESLYGEAQSEHAQYIEDRAQELLDIWNEESKDFEKDPRYGSGSILRQHPVLPMGSAGSFHLNQPEPQGDLDPLEVLDQIDANVEGKLTREERDAARRVIREKLHEGYQQLGEVDEDAAKEHLDRDKWYEEHSDTENRLMDSAIQSFDSWKQANNYHDYNSDEGGGGGGGGRRNDDAPHPEGGSLQRWTDSEYGGRLTEESGARMAVLDYALGTMDRHVNNLLWHDGEPVAIDNGYSMPSTNNDTTFRSVAVGRWMGLNNYNDIPEETRAPILKALESTDWKALLDRHPGMNRNERDAFLERIEHLKEAMSYESGLSTLWHDQQFMDQ